MLLHRSNSRRRATPGAGLQGVSDQSGNCPNYRGIYDQVPLTVPEIEFPLENQAILRCHNRHLNEFEGRMSNRKSFILVEYDE